MAKRIIRTGTTADPTGDSLKNAFTKVNDNFTELYNALGLDADTLNLGAFEFSGSVMTTTDSSAIVIDQAATITSNLSVGGDILPQTANGGDLGSSTLPWRSLYVSNNTIYIGGTAVGVDANGSLTTGGTVVGSTPAWNSITGKPTLFSGSYNDLTDKPDLAGTYQFFVAADDSTQRLVSTDEVIKFVGAGGITTSSDAEGNITITGSGGGGGSTLVNGAYTVSLGSDGTLTAPGNITSKTLTVSNGSAGYESQLFVNDNANNRILFRNYNNRQGVAGYDYSSYNSGIVVDAGSDGYTVVSGGHSGSSNSTSFTFDFRTLANGTSAQRMGVLRFDSGIDNGPSLSNAVSMKYFPTTDSESNGTYYEFATTGLRFLDATVQTTAYTGPQTFLDGDVTGSVFADDSTLLVDGVSGIVPNSELAKSITQVIDSNATVNTSATVTTNNSYTNTVDFSTDVDPGVGYAIAGWYQRNSTQIEFALFGPSAFQTYLLGLALGRTVIVTYSTGSGNQTLTRTLTQTFSATGQADPANPTWGRVSGRIDATLPADQTGIVSINFPVYSTSTKTWTFGTGGLLSLGASRGGIYANQTTGMITIGDNIAPDGTPSAPSTVIQIGGATNAFVISAYGPPAANWTFGMDGALTVPGDIKSSGNINIDINLTDSTLRRWSFGEDGKLTFPDGANYAGQTVTMPTTNNGTPNSFVWEFSDNSLGSDRITLNWNLLASDTAGFYIGTTHSTTGKYLFLDGTDQSLSYTAGGGIFGGGKLIFGSSAGNNAGDYNAIEIKATNGDVYLTSTESVKITVDAADSSARIWTFDPTGELTVPGPISGLGNNKLEFTANSGAVFSGSNGNTISIYANDGDIGSSADINIYTNTAGSLNSWTFDTDGRTRFPTATAPAHSYGAAGDVPGTVAFDDSYIYYCTTNYSGLMTILNVSTQSGGAANGYFFNIANDALSAVRVGWTITGPNISGSANITQITSSAADVWEFQTDAGAVNLRGQFGYILRGYPDIWKRVALDATSW